MGLRGLLGTAEDLREQIDGIAHGLERAGDNADRLGTLAPADIPIVLGPNGEPVAGGGGDPHGQFAPSMAPKRGPGGWAGGAGGVGGSAGWAGGAGGVGGYVGNPNFGPSGGGGGGMSGGGGSAHRGRVLGPGEFNGFSGRMGGGDGGGGGIRWDMGNAPAGAAPININPAAVVTRGDAEVARRLDAVNATLSAIHQTLATGPSALTRRRSMR